MNRSPSLCLAVLLALGCGWLVDHAALASDGEIKAGAYCPFPKEGEVPSCMAPAQSTYGEFFSSLDATGAPSAAEAARLEADLISGVDRERSYLALSSLTYAYYRLAQAASQSPDARPELTERLERWNGLLSAAYAESADQRFQSAVREAATDLHERAPSIATECDGISGQTCNTTGSLLAALDRMDQRGGMRTPLTHLLNRVIGERPE